MEVFEITVLSVQCDPAGCDGRMPAGVVALGTYIVGGRVCGTTRRHNPAVDRLWPDAWPEEIPDNRQSVARSL